MEIVGNNKDRRTRYREYLVTIHEQDGNDIVSWKTLMEATKAIDSNTNISVTGPKLQVNKRLEKVDTDSYSVDE